MSKNLQMPLIKKWFDLSDTPNGKTEDYREITPYWCSRFLYVYGLGTMPQKWWLEEYFENYGTKCSADEIVENISIFCSFLNFETNTMTLGYPKSTDKERIKIFEHAGIEIRYGKPEWGAEPNKLYFIIKHGKRLQ